MEDEKKGHELAAQTLSDVPTRDLVNELKGRNGVIAHWAMPYEAETITINGPAIVIVVID